MSIGESGGTRRVRRLFRPRVHRRGGARGFVGGLALGTAVGAWAVLLVACGGGERRTAARTGDGEDSASAAAAPRTVLFLGTSLTAGLGLDPDQAFPALIQRKIDAAGLPYRVVNAGVSGETSAGALRRLDWLLRQPFEVLVLETGANDMLRGGDLDSLRSNLQAIVDKVRRARPGVRIVLAGMRAPPNLGLAYALRYRRVYEETAERDALPFIPFLLDGVAAHADLNQPDGIHPNARGEARVAENVWDVLEGVLREADATLHHRVVQ